MSYQKSLDIYIRRKREGEIESCGTLIEDFIGDVKAKLNFSPVYNSIEEYHTVRKFLKLSDKSSQTVGERNK